MFVRRGRLLALPLSHSLAYRRSMLHAQDHNVSLCEDILWRRLPSNAAVLANLETRQLRNESSIPEMRHLLSILDISQEDLTSLRVIHVAGSKGKGSTSAFLESIMRRAGGLRTALFTSPHLLHPRERICINGMPMAEDDFCQQVISLYAILAKYSVSSSGFAMPGFFRFMTLLALRRMVELRRRNALDVAIIEVGMGGRYDATNVIDSPAVCVITSLAMEHVRQLGPTISDIARHKIGIAKPGVVCFSVPQDAAAMTVMQEECLKLGARLQVVGNLDPLSDTVNLGIDGEHQKMNASLALAAAKEWFALHQSTLNGSLNEALMATKWPGRHQIHRDYLHKHTWYVDGAHTIESITYALRWYAKHTASLPQRHRVLVFHCTHDRSFEHLLTPVMELGSFFDRVLFVKPPIVTDTAEEMTHPDLSLHQSMASYWGNTREVASIDSKGDSAMALPLRQLPLHLTEGDQILVIGSLYLVGAIMTFLDIPFSLQ